MAVADGRPTARADIGLGRKALEARRQVPDPPEPPSRELRAFSSGPSSIPPSASAIAGPDYRRPLTARQGRVLTGDSVAEPSAAHAGHTPNKLNPVALRGVDGVLCCFALVPTKSGSFSGRNVRLTRYVWLQIVCGARERYAFIPTLPLTVPPDEGGELTVRRLHTVPCPPCLVFPAPKSTCKFCTRPWAMSIQIQRGKPSRVSGATINRPARRPACTYPRENARAVAGVRVATERLENGGPNRTPGAPSSMSSEQTLPAIEEKSD